MNVIYPDFTGTFHRERVVVRKESHEDIVRREVMARCLKAGVPLEMARIQADSACDAVRRGYEQGAADRAVDRAIKGSFPDGPDAA